MGKVTIIIPIYNVADYIRRTIDSVCCQTESDIEIILVDDGSTDSSGTICDEAALADTRIKVIHKQNGGLSSARNAGANTATAEYVMFLDGDDYLREDAVECCLKAMQAYPCDFVQYLYQEVEEGQRPVRREPAGKIYQAKTSKELFKNLYRLGGVAASGATKFMRRSLALEIPFENIRHEDEMWCTRAFQRELTVTYLPEELYYYVMRKNSIIHCAFNHKKIDIFCVCRERIKVLTELELDDLAGLECNKLFLAVLRLYCEAKDANDTYGLDVIKHEFTGMKSQIKQYANLNGKFSILFEIMYSCYHVVYLYYRYNAWKIHGN